MVFLLALIVSSSFVCSNLVVSTSMITDTAWCDEATDFHGII